MSEKKNIAAVFTHFDDYGYLNYHIAEKDSRLICYLLDGTEYTNQDIKWTTSDSNIVSISPLFIKGETSSWCTLTIKGEGAAIVTASLPDGEHINFPCYCHGTESSVSINSSRGESGAVLNSSSSGVDSSAELTVIVSNEIPKDADTTVPSNVFDTYVDKLNIVIPEGFTFIKNSDDNKNNREQETVGQKPLPVKSEYTFKDKVYNFGIKPIDDYTIPSKSYPVKCKLVADGKYYEKTVYITVYNLDYVPPEPEPEDEVNEYFIGNDFCDKLYNSFKSFANNKDYIKEAGDPQFKNYIADSDVYGDIVRVVGIWQAAASSEYADDLYRGSSAKAMSKYVLEFYNVDVIKNGQKKKATIGFRFINDLAYFEYVTQILSKNQIDFDGVFEHTEYWIDYYDSSVYDFGIYNMKAGGSLSKYYENSKKYLNKQFDNEIKSMLKNGFYKAVDRVSALDFMSAAVDFLRLYEKANGITNKVEKLVKTSVQFGIVLSEYKKYKVSCPVDVYVYDESGEYLLGSIVNDIVAEENIIDMYMDGETKCFELLDYRKYNIKLVGNGTGTMTYRIEEYGQNDVYVKTTDFYNVELKPDLTYTAEIKTVDGTETQVLTLDNGTQLLPSAVYNGDVTTVHTLTATVTLPGGGTSSVALMLLDSTGKVISSGNTSGGKLSFDDIENGSYTLRASKSKYAPRDYKITVGDDPLNLNIKLNKYGDVNGDGSINANDATQILRFNIGLSSVFSAADESTRDYLSKVACINAAFDSEKTLSQNDATQILRHMMFLPSLFDKLD